MLFWKRQPYMQKGSPHFPRICSRLCPFWQVLKISNCQWLQMTLSSYPWVVFFSISYYFKDTMSKCLILISPSSWDKSCATDRLRVSRTKLVFFLLSRSEEFYFGGSLKPTSRKFDFVWVYAMWLGEDSTHARTD